MRRQRSGHRPYPAGIGGSGTLQGSGNGSRGNLAGFRGRFKLFQDSVLDTCRTLEGVFDDEVTLVEMPELTGRSQLGAISEHEGGIVDEHGHDPDPVRDHDDLEQNVEGETSHVAASVSPVSPVEQRGSSGSASLSLDSLYIQETMPSSQRGDRSSQHPQPGMERPISAEEPSPLTPDSVYPGWRRDSVDEAEQGTHR